MFCLSVRKQPARLHPGFDPDSITQDRYTFYVPGMIHGEFEFFKQHFRLHMTEAFDLDEKPYFPRCSDLLSHDCADLPNVFTRDPIADLEPKEFSRTPAQLLIHWNRLCENASGSIRTLSPGGTPGDHRPVSERFLSGIQRTAGSIPSQDASPQRSTAPRPFFLPDRNKDYLRGTLPCRCLRTSSD